jgi:RimJ/RimL family protein N-acetyltransferase
MLDLALADPETSAVVGCARASNGGSLRVLQKLGLVRIGEVWLPDAPEPTVTLIRRK